MKYPSETPKPLLSTPNHSQTDPGCAGKPGAGLCQVRVRHLVAEEHIGFNRVWKWLRARLSSILIRKTYPTFLLSDEVP